MFYYSLSTLYFIFITLFSTFVVNLMSSKNLHERECESSEPVRCYARWSWEMALESLGHSDGRFAHDAAVSVNN